MHGVQLANAMNAEGMSGALMLQFTLRLLAAILLGSAVGTERQWRQRIAGTRTNALVSAGAAAFVMSALLLHEDSSAMGRIASYVVSGVGFLGAGVIFKEGGNVRGLNTAATVWCSAAMGVLCGFGAPLLALILAIAIVLTNVVLRPLAARLGPAVMPVDPVADTSYQIALNCSTADESHLRLMLLGTLSQLPATLQSLHSEDLDSPGRMRILALLTTPGARNDVAEEIVRRLSVEPHVTAINWSVIPAGDE